MTGSQVEVAHLTLDPARIAPAAPGHEAFLQNLLQHAFMKAFTQPRGNSVDRGEFAPDHTDGVQKRELIGIDIGFEGGLVHQAED